MVHQVQQRVISAAGAPPVTTTAPNSPFAAAGQYLGRRGAQEEPEQAGEQPAADAPAQQPLRPRVRQVLASRAPLTDEQIAERLGERDLRKVRRCLANMVHTGEAQRGVDGEGRDVVQLKPEKVRATRKQVSSRKNGGGQPADTARTLAVAPAPATATPLPSEDQDDFRCGLFSDGTLEIFADGESKKLTRPRVRKLVAYLDKLASALAD